MKTFEENPHSRIREGVNKAIFHRDLSKTLQTKFKHKTFSERFALANLAFVGMSGIAQFASLTTAFTMLSYLFVNINIIVRIACSAALVLAIEVIKRESSNDVMKGLFQYKKVEPFSVILAIVTVCTSIYISVEGAKILPYLFISDAVELVAEQKSPEAIETNYKNRIADLEVERNAYRKNRMWKGRLARKDSKIIEKYNASIQDLESEKASALVALDSNNQVASQVAAVNFQIAVAKVAKDREALSAQLVMAAIGFEILFLISLCFSWWYYTNCEKEKENDSKNSTTNSSPSSSQTDTGSSEREEAHEAPTAKKKASFVDYEEITPEEIIIKEKYTRICPQCNTGFVHNAWNHTYCSKTCGTAAREARTAKDKQ